LCLKCHCSFSINHGRKKPVLWIPHIDGVPFRKLGDENSLSGKQTFLKVQRELNSLPWNYELTKSLCNPSLFSRILIIDGKYIKVKGFDAKIPFVYGIDYLTHDIPHGELYPVEDEISFSEYLSKLKGIGYTPSIVVADDRGGLKTALNKVFPYARLQLCHNHYLENIRQTLNIRTDERYLHFFNSLRLHVFLEGMDEQKITQGLMYIFHRRTLGKRTLQNIVYNIKYRQTELFNYLHIKDCPNNTNLIELYNSHLQGRLKSIKGFQSFNSARRWLNGYLIRRRTKPLTDCKTKFKHLNKHCSLQFTIKKQAKWPDILTKLGINKIKFYEKSD